MNINKYLIIFKLLLFSGCLCEISEGEKEKLLNGFLEHYNSLPDQIYQSNEGSLQSTQQVDDTTYEIVVKLTAKEIQNAEVTKSLTCTATLKDSDDHVRVTHSHCEYPGQEDSSQEKASEGQAEVTEPVLERRPVQLDNEVQSDTAISSGEQFIAIPRDQPSVPCFGCATHVNPQAAGVSELASLGLRHLDIHQPSTKHTLDRVLDVERQVQVVNGVRYILTMSVNFNNCSDTQPENCMSSNICKITFLVKPWVKLSNGANYRAILGNNCTEEWLYGDNGEVLPESVDNQAHDKDEGNKGNDGGDIQVKHHTDVQSQPNMEKTLTDEEIKNLEEQIIPNNQFQENYQPSSTMSPDSPEVNKEHVFKAESSKRNENSIPVTEQNLNINSDKKKAIDDLLNFFDFSGFKLKTESTDTVPRIRRSYDYDLQLLTLAEDYHGIKNSIENARFIYGLAQTMVNYLNEMDLEVKNRVVKSVIKAEEEADSLQRYIYVQASVTIPCDKVECEPKDSSTQICNGVIDATNDDSPQIISSFCYDDNKERDYRDSVKEIPLDDPVLQNFVLEAVKKIESESKSENALKVNKIISAITQVTSGTLTKFSIIVDNLKCNKSVPLALRTNCKVLEQLGSQICEIIVHERHWMKETKISYSCTDRPVDMKISKKVKSITQSVNVEDPKIIEMLQEAIQFLETKSEKNNKQKIVNVTSITSQIIAGFLTKIEFVVGYTNCTDGIELVDESNKCQLLKGQNLRLCKAQFWDRSWIIDGRQVEVSCDDVKRKKRSVDFVESQGNDEGSPEIKYKKLANESLQKFMQSSPSHQHYEVVKVDKVDVQNVPDKLIRIKFSISPTNCELKNGILSPNECHVINPENVIYCHSKILENVWVDKKQFFVNCNLKDYRRYEKSSGLQERDPNDSKYVKKSDSLKQNIKDSNAMQIAVEALQTFLKNNPESLLLRVTLVDKVVIEGPTTKIAFLASHTEDDDGDTICYAEFFASKGVTEVKCHSIGLTIRQTEVTDEDPNYYKYIQLADESLYIYLQKINSSQLYTVASIESVMVQWDEGIKTQINFIISPTDLENHENQAKQCRAEIREQPWIYKKNIDVKCELDRNLYRSKRQVYDKKNVIGGLTNKDPNDPKYRVLAEESLRKFITDSGTTEDLQLVRVEKVTTQVVSGSLTRIDFVISGGQVINKCHSKIWEQPWMNKKDIEVSCHNGDQRSKREAILGGLTEQNPNDPKYRALAEASLRKFILNSRTTEHLQLVRVEKVTTQVVSGTLIRIDFVISGGRDISKCHSEIWEQPWMNKKQIDVSCHNGDQSSKREAMTGGLTDRNPIDPQYRMMAEESLLKFIVESGTTRPLRVVRVEKVTTQVVAGSLTRIEFEISVGQDIYKCHSKIWVQPWLNKKYIEVSCHNGDQSRKKEAIPGGLTDRNPNDPKYRALAEESLQKFITDSGTTEPLQIVRIEKITTQEVIGPLNHIDFVISDGQDINKCHSEIWEQPWMNKNYIEVSCHNSDQKNKSEAIPGGLTDQNPNDPKYRALAEESLRKFIVESGTTQPLRVVRVEKVTTQVVAGSLTRIDFVISGGQDINKCHSKIWEQPWINKKDIEVSCHNGDQKNKSEAIPGGLTDQNPNDPKYRALAEESLLKFIADSGTTEPLKMVRVEKVTTQVVAGMMTRIDFTVSDGKSKTMKCHSEILEQVWVGRKEVNVDCLPINIRARRDLVMPRGLVEQNLIKPKFNVPLGKKPSPGSGTEMSLHNVRGNDEEEQNPNKPEYKLLAEESLRKFQQKSTVYHKVLEVKRVLTRVVSGLKYNIDFTAAPTACSVNESRVNARRCKTDDEIILYCHTEIWDRPWLRKKNIDVQCNDPSDDRDDFVEDDSDIAEVNSEKESNNSENHMKLANAATEKYLTASNRKYVHKVTGIQSISEPQLDGTFTIDFTISPTTCLRNVTNKDSCKVKQPVVVFHCNAKIRNLPSGNNENEIEVTCRKASEGVNKSKKDKRDVGIGNARQTVDDAEEMDEDVIYYYADRALQHVNDNSRSNNLHKLISIHAVQSSVQMGERTVKMYIEIAETYCLRHHRTKDLKNCEELNGLNHRLCLARLWPAPDEELITRHISVVCDDEEDFVAITGVNVPELLRLSLIELERAPGAKYKLVHQGEPQVIPSLDSRQPFKINFIVAYTNCSIDVDLDKNPFQCYLNTEIPSKTCHSFIWLKTDIRHISYINVKCANLNRWRRSTNQTNTTSENGEINSMVAAALEKLEMSSLHRYKQRVLQINSHSTKITSGKVTTIDFDVGYTSCLKYEWVENITSCDFLEHLPRRRCVAQIWERLWIKNGQNIDVNCVDDETPLESHIEFESAEMANALAKEALKHIEAKYPHPSKQKVVRIFSLEKQVVAGIHYKMKVEVGFTDCLALSDQTDCKLLKDHGLNKFCRVNVWVRPWTDHPPNFRVSCDFQEGATHDLYHHVQAEQLFYNFLTTYSPSYVNDYSQMQKRFEIFKNNIKKIHELNVHEKGTAVYGVTRFADLTYEEFSSTYMGLNTNLTNENQVPMTKADIPDIKLPEDFDWREHDAVTEVKDQGQCGSCWAFSVTGNIEGQWKMQSGQLVSLSEQELVDCDKLDDGCNGGLPDNAYRAIEQMGGLELESDYPYEGVGEKCEFNKTLAKVQISGAVNITTNETGMAQWLVHNGPISIGINANAMQFYMGGISHPWKMLCNPTNLDHGVLIVGYGIKDYPLFHKKLPYWIIKNSWGKSWGEQGYYRVYRGDGTCGVNQMASSAII